MLGSFGRAKDIGKIPCVVCGKLFRPKVANQLTCSDKCKKINKANRDKARKAKIRLAKSEPVTLKKGDKFKANGEKFVCVKGGKKPVVKVVKGKAVEKIVLPKKPVAKIGLKNPMPPKNPVINTIITVKNGDPFEVYFLASMVREKAKREILAMGRAHFFAGAKKGE